MALGGGAGYAGQGGYPLDAYLSGGAGTPVKLLDATLAVGTWWAVESHSQRDLWTLQWSLKTGAAGSATITVYNTTFPDRPEFSEMNPATNPERWFLTPIVFTSNPAGAVGTEVLPIDVRWTYSLVQIVVAVQMSPFSLRSFVRR